MKTMNILKSITLILFVNLFLFACTDDDDDSVNNNGGSNITPNEEELITTVELQFSDTMGTAVDTFRFRDPDGDGGNQPTIDTLRLSSDSIYDLNIKFLDESDPMDVEDITMEIMAEDDEHLVCFDMGNMSAVQFIINKTDSDGNYELGLQSRWQTFAAFEGSVKVILKHQPGVKDGTCAPGETDIEVDFPLIVMP